MKTGNPNGAELLTWTQYNLDRADLMMFTLNAEAEMTAASWKNAPSHAGKSAIGALFNRDPLAGKPKGERWQCRSGCDFVQCFLPLKS